MKTLTKYITIHTKQRIEFVNVTSDVQQAVKESKVREGIVLINPKHITSAVFINDNEEGLHKDFLEWFEKLAPKKKDYHHHQTGEDNGYSHLWRTMMGREVVVAITDSKLDLGAYETIFYGEFDGQRDKKVLIKIIGE